MSSWGELLDRAAPEEHIVQLYGSDDQLLARNVSRYLAEGLKRGDGLVLIATSEHAATIVRQLSEESHDALAALRDGRLMVLDAKETLERFMVNGEPDQNRFRSVVGDALREVGKRSASGQIRAFGEMVGLLWVDGQHAAAIRLEQYWNELLAGSAFSLYCAYPIDISDAGLHLGGLEAVLGAHTHMYASPRTVLSSTRATR